MAARLVGPLRDAAEAHVRWLLAPHGLDDASTLVYPFVVQLLASWAGFLFFAARDYRAWKAGTLKAEKLPSRHPLTDYPAGADGILCGVRLEPFWYTQLSMAPAVLFNQCVAWPLASLLVVWPQWETRHRPLAEWGAVELLLWFAALMLIADQLWCVRVREGGTARWPRGALARARASLS
jgi:hypothetical protein